MSKESFQLSAESGRAARWSRNASVIAALTLSLGTLTITSASASGPASTVTPMALSVPAAPAAATGSRLSPFDSALLTMINAKRAAVGAGPLREVVGLDDTSAAWSNSVLALGRYGAVPTNPNVATQTLSAEPARSAFSQSVAKWYPQSVKVADVFSLYVQSPKTYSDMTNGNYKYVGIRTAAAADGTSVATLTYTDSAVTTQVVDPSTAASPTGALTAAVQAGTSVQLRGTATDPDAVQAVQVKVTDTVGSQTVNTVDTSVTGGVFDATVPLIGYGDHTLCATVVNQGAGADLALGCTNARLGTLIGNADTLRQYGDQLVTSGWGYDPAAPTTALSATLVVNGPAGSRSLTILSNGTRNDVARAYAGAGPDHGYRIAVPTLGRGVNTVCVTLQPASAGAMAKKLACRSITVS